MPLGQLTESAVLLLSDDVLDGEDLAVDEDVAAVEVWRAHAYLEQLQGVV